MGKDATVGDFNTLKSSLSFFLRYKPAQAFHDQQEKQGRERTTLSKALLSMKEEAKPLIKTLYETLEIQHMIHWMKVMGKPK